MFDLPLMQAQPILFAAITISVVSLILLGIGINAIVTKRMPETAMQQIGSKVLHGKSKKETTGKMAVILGWAFVGLSVFAALIAASVWYTYLTQDPEANQPQNKYLEQQRPHGPSRLDGMEDRLKRQDRGFGPKNGFNSRK